MDKYIEVSAQASYIPCRDTLGLTSAQAARHYGSETPLHIALSRFHIEKRLILRANGLGTELLETLTSLNGLC